MWDEFTYPFINFNGSTLNKEVILSHTSLGMLLFIPAGIKDTPS